MAEAAMVETASVFPGLPDGAGYFLEDRAGGGLDKSYWRRFAAPTLVPAGSVISSRKHCYFSDAIPAIEQMFA